MHGKGGLLGRKIKISKNGVGEEYQVLGNYIHPCEKVLPTPEPQNNHQLQKRDSGKMSSVNPTDPQYVIKHDGVYLLVVMMEPLQDMQGLEDFKATLEVEFLSPTGDFGFDRRLKPRIYLDLTLP